MISALSTALSGMQAASLRMDATASNLANMDTVGSLTPGGKPAYQPVTVAQAALPGGGVSASLQKVSPATVTDYDPQSSSADPRGLVAAPNVDMIAEVTNMVSAKLGFSASMQVAQVSSDMVKKLYDLT